MFNRKYKLKKKAAAAAIAFIVVVAAAAAFIVYENSLVYKNCRVEAGIAVDVSDFLKKTDEKAYIKGNNGVVDTSVPGKYRIKIKTGLFCHKSTLIVQDTIAPDLQVKDMITGYGETLEASDFVVSVTDATSVEITFSSEVDFKTDGEQQVEIAAKDLGGNITKKTAVLTVRPVKNSLTIEAGSTVPEAEEFVLDKEIKNVSILSDISEIETNHVAEYEVLIQVAENTYTVVLKVQDTEPPVITGAVNQTIYEGNSISYRNIVKAIDNCPEGLELSIDSSEVNVNKAGTYTVYCTATDAAGNTANASFTVTVLVHDYSQSAVYAMADSILANLITQDMSQYEKAQKIFWYVRNNMSFYDSSEKDNWIKAAGEAMTNRSGDCYNYACLSKVLLTRAGIKNMDIEMIPKGNQLHYWNLVDIGDGHGWYHFDTTPRIPDRPTIFLWTDSQMMEYSAAHSNCFNYDKSAYPEIP